jgi:hypothetical protein
MTGLVIIRIPSSARSGSPPFPFAALPPDVRKVYDLPWLFQKSGAMPPIWGVAPKQLELIRQVVDLPHIRRRSRITRALVD